LEENRNLWVTDKFFCTDLVASGVGRQNSDVLGLYVVGQMGGCPELTMTCNSSTCSGHEVDLMHFYLNKAIPGRLYGSNLFDNINGTGRDR
jgi:hypothetical protein